MKYEKNLNIRHIIGIECKPIKSLLVYESPVLPDSRRILSGSEMSQVLYQKNVLICFGPPKILPAGAPDKETERLVALTSEPVLNLVQIEILLPPPL